MDQVQQFVDPLRQFVKDSYRLIKRCTKPDRREFQKIACATAVGFAIMGFIGFFVKLIHIPVNNIIVWVKFFCEINSYSSEHHWVFICLANSYSSKQHHCVSVHLSS